MAVARNQCDAANLGERWRDVGWRRVGVIFAGLNAVAHEDYRNALIVIIGSSMGSAVMARICGGAVIPRPVGLGNDDEIAATRPVEAGGFGAENRIQSRRTAVDIVGEVNLGDAGNAFDGF